MHILVIEDDPRLAELLQQLLTGDRHVVEVAANGRDGLDAGADDCLVKPFAFEELAARLRSITRRPAAAPVALLTCGPIALDDVHRTVTVDDRPVERTWLNCRLR